MMLRYISIHMDNASGYDSLTKDKFNLSSRFISHYLSVQVRKLKFHTDNTFNMIAVTPVVESPGYVRKIVNAVLHSQVGFDEKNYLSMSTIEKCEYYLRLLEEGYKICSQSKEIPLGKLLKLNNQFRDNEYRNDWVHKKKRFKEQGFESILACSFTSTNFTATITIIDLKNKETLVSGVLIITKPDEVFFDSLFKDIIISDTKLIITEFQDRPKFIFNLEDIYNKKFFFTVTNSGLNYEPYLAIDKI